MNEGIHKPRVLLLNDDEELLMLMDVLLEGDGFHPIITPNEAEALRLLHAGGIDVFIQDIIRGAETMGGWAFFDVLHQDSSLRDVPSICMTGVVRTADFAQRLARLGVDGYVGLPIDARHFPNYIRAVIDRREPRAEEEPPRPGPGDQWREEERMIQEYLRWASHRRRAGLANPGGSSGAAG